MQSAVLERDCPVCRRSHERRDEIGAFPPTHHATFSQSEFKLVDCDGCGLIYISPAPTKDDLDLLYVKTEQFTHEAYTDEAKAQATVDYLNVIYGHALRISQANERPGPRRVLEIGSGLAWMCRSAKTVDDNVFTVAQDVTAEAVNQAPWVDDYIVGEVTDPRLDAHAPYDIASMTHVIEHLVQPIAVLQRIASLLRSGGVLFVSAPYRPIGWSRGGDAKLWESYDYHHIPAHTQYFSEKALGQAAAQSGFELVAWNEAHESGKAFDALLVKA